MSTKAVVISPSTLNFVVESCNIRLAEDCCRALYSDPSYASYVARRAANGFPSLDPDLSRTTCPLKRNTASVTQLTLPPPAKIPRLVPPSPKPVSAPSAPSAPINAEWTSRFQPQTFEEIFGQANVVTQARRWLNSCDWHFRVLLLTGGTGTGKSSIARLLLPDATVVNCETYSNDLLYAAWRPRGQHFALSGSSSSGTSSSGSGTMHSSMGLIIHDFGCITREGQSYILNSLWHFIQRGSKQLFPLPIVFVLGENDFSSQIFKRITPNSLRLTVGNLSQKALQSLAAKILARAGIRCRFDSPAVVAAAKNCTNPRSFIKALDAIYSGSRLAGAGSVADSTQSPFEVLRSLYLTGTTKSPLEAADLHHWLLENTVPLLENAPLSQPESTNLLSLQADFVNMLSEVNVILKPLWQPSTMGEACSSIGHMMGMKARLLTKGLAIRCPLITDMPVKFPASFRRIVAGPSVALRSPLDQAFHWTP